MNLRCLELYHTGEEITRATTNKIYIIDQLFHKVREEPTNDICGLSYRVDSLANPNVNPNSPFVAMMKEKKQTQGSYAFEVPQIRPPPTRLIS